MDGGRKEAASRKRTHRTLGRWLQEPERGEIAKEIKRASSDQNRVREAVGKMHEATVAHFDQDETMVDAFELFLGFMATMPETVLGVNPFYFIRSKVDRQLPEHPEDPTHVLSSVRLMLACAQCCFPKQTSMFLAAAPLERWLDLIGFRPMGKTGSSFQVIQGASPTLPMMSCSVLTEQRKELLDENKRTSLACSSWCYGHWKTFRAWRELAVERRLDEAFPRVELYDRVWRTTVPEVTRFAVPRSNNFELSRPSFFAMPCFSAQGCPTGPLDRLFYRGCAPKDDSDGAPILPKVHAHVCGTELCLYPAEFMEDHEDAFSNPTLVLQRLCLLIPSTEDKWVPRNPPEPLVHFEAQLASNPCLSKFRLTHYNDDDEQRPPTPPPALLDDDDA